MASTRRISLKWHPKAVTIPSPHPSQEIRILVVDDNALMRRSLRTLLEAQDNWKVCDEATDGREAVAKFNHEKFDVVVLDFQMPEMDGLEAAKQITRRSSTTPILMVTMHSSPQLAVEARKAGIRGMCAKADTKCVIEGVAAVLENKPYFQN
ncbi:MAG: response regulator transcription factor [Candidatus Sulfotelmatobacter sp.]